MSRKDIRYLPARSRYQALRYENDTLRASDAPPLTKCARYFSIRRCSKSSRRRLSQRNKKKAKKKKIEAREHEWMLRIALNSYIDDLTATLRADKRPPFAL